MKFETVITADTSKPGIYVWEIEGQGVYVGKYTHASRPLKEYARNVKKMVEGKPYRKSKPDGFRKIHRAMFEAVKAGAHIKLTIVENAEPENLNALERQWIEAVGTLNAS